jgi:hypothetical protein
MTASCCIIIPIQAGAILIAVLGVLSGGGFSVAYARNISEMKIFLADSRSAFNALPYVGMASWMLLSLLSFFGVWASWTARRRLVAIYFFIYLGHYIFDLGILAGTYFVVLNSGNIVRDNCNVNAINAGFSNTEELCKTPISMAAILFITFLAVYKVFSTYATYVIYQFWKHIKQNEREDEEALRRLQARRITSRPEMYTTTKPEYSRTNLSRNWSRFDDD